ncbi:hypothetical protein ACFE04_030449 [Oxalis oulophora]
MLDSDELKIENGTENSFCDGKNNKGFVNQYESNDGNGWGESKVDCTMDVAYSRKSVNPFEDDSVFYFDKSVTDCALPEIIVCYKENTYNVVKDICIDEGLPSNDKFFFESSEDEKIVRTFPQAVNDGISELIEGKQNHRMDLSTENHCSEKMDNQYDTTLNFMSTSETGEQEKEKIADCVSKEKLSLGQMFAMENLDLKNADSMSSDLDCCAAEQPSVQMSSGSIEERNNDALLIKETDLASTSTLEELNNGSDPSEESLNDTKETLAVPAEAESESIIATTISEELAGEPEESSPENDSCHNGKLETSPIDLESCPPLASGSVEGCNQTNTDELPVGESSTEQSQSNGKEETSLIDFDSCAPRASGRSEECNETRVGELPVAESNTDDSQSNELFISEGKDSLGESSFTMAGLPVSGLISYSGAIAYSGSISHRSDSSTTSNRSFAFPVLPNEWNSSPVRMAKAERRRYRKQRGWRLIIPCCRV